MSRIHSLMLLVDSHMLSQLPSWPHGEALHAAIDRAAIAKGGMTLTLIAAATPLPVAIGVLPSGASTFAALGLAARLVKAVSPFAPQAVGLAALTETAGHSAALDALASALLAATESQPNAKREAPARWQPKQVRVAGTLPATTLASHAGGHLCRWLTALPPNALNPGTYRRAIGTLARRHGWQVETYDERRLRSLGAGAFLAVVAGSARRDAAIVRIRYQPKGARRARPIALVGKGLCFDTGGHGLKSAASMLNMHSDMAGSAVALGTLLALSETGYDRPVDAWLALAENRIGPDAYTPQDVVTALDGTTIQVVHTDAEGRMALADTLALASRSRPAAIVDFATLTGAAVSALTERLSAFFTNTDALRPVAEAAGAAAGERVHGFPMPADFDDDLDSPTADIAQCLIGGKGDHIYAARFLNRFVPGDIPWLHCDLSAAERSGGLAHVPHTITGFGVRFCRALLDSDAFTHLLAR